VRTERVARARIAAVFEIHLGEETCPESTRNQPPGLRKKTLEQASGYFLTKSKLYRAAQEAVELQSAAEMRARSQRAVNRASSACGP